MSSKKENSEEISLVFDDSFESKLWEKRNQLTEEEIYQLLKEEYPEYYTEDTLEEMRKKIKSIE